MSKLTPQERMDKIVKGVLHPIESRKARETKKREREAISHLDETKYDLATFERRIRRCEALIKKGRCAGGNQMKLEALEALVKAQETKSKLYPDLSEETINRLDQLDMIEQTLFHNKDPFGELKNVQAIIAAYQSKEMEVDGNASYWCDGKRLDEVRRPFSWKDFRRLNTEENRNGGGFWAEGMFNGTSQLNRFTAAETCDQSTIHETYMNMTLRFRGSQHTWEDKPEVTMRFLDDTAASTATIYWDDMLTLQGADSVDARHKNPLPNIMGYHPFANAGRHCEVLLVIAVEVNLPIVSFLPGLARAADPGDILTGEPKEPTQKIHGKFVRDGWEDIMCAVYPRCSVPDAPGESRPRLNGPFVRQVLFTATAPPCKPRWEPRRVFGVRKDAAFATIPNPDIRNIAPPWVIRPRYAAQDWYNPESGEIEAKVDRLRRGTLPREARRLAAAKAAANQ
ncbi:hypothetical protein N7456_007220 [Penicillium angulare]|uniref:Uncharacterized protein n=1 Tax=Penicillium angulare TaxID=116970 RepID=A0A9W9FJ37_9EURO|nr:hypothetical protein N7456_007220 [Penicillium angulare]